MMLCLRKGAKVCGKRTLYFFTDFILYFSPVLQFFRELFTFYATKLGLQIAEMVFQTLSGYFSQILFCCFCHNGDFF